MNFLLKKKEDFEKIYDRGYDSNVSDLDNHNINSSENYLNSIEDFEGIEDLETKKNQMKS